MNKLLERLGALGPERLKGVRRGIEKESLRAQPGGQLALTPHPAALEIGRASCRERVCDSV